MGRRVGTQTEFACLKNCRASTSVSGSKAAISRRTTTGQLLTVRFWQLLPVDSVGRRNTSFKTYR